MKSEQLVNKNPPSSNPDLLSVVREFTSKYSTGSLTFAEQDHLVTRMEKALAEESAKESNRTSIAAEPSPCPSAELIDAVRRFIAAEDANFSATWSAEESRAFDRLENVMRDFDASPAGASTEQARIDRAVVEKLEELATTYGDVLIIRRGTGWKVALGSFIHNGYEWTKPESTLAETLGVK